MIFVYRINYVQAYFLTISVDVTTRFKKVYFPKAVATSNNFHCTPFTNVPSQAHRQGYIKRCEDITIICRIALDSAPAIRCLLSTQCNGAVPMSCIRMPGYFLFNSPSTILLSLAISSSFDAIIFSYSSFWPE